MATQFETLHKLLLTIHRDIIDLTAEVRELKGQDLTLDDEVPSEGDDPRPRSRPQMNRREVEVKANDGGTIFVAWSDIQPEIIKAVEIASKRGLDYELYEGADATVRIMVDAEVAHIIRKEMSDQLPVPKGDIPKDMDIDEVARPQ